MSSDVQDTFDAMLTALREVRASWERTYGPRWRELNWPWLHNVDAAIDKAEASPLYAGGCWCCGRGACLRPTRLELRTAEGK